MVCGFHRGYYGIQVNSETERRILFSTWDNSEEQKLRRFVPDCDRVRCTAKHSDADGSDFENEGTGWHLYRKFDWTKNKKYRFVVTAKNHPENGSTTMTAKFFENSTKKWEIFGQMQIPNYKEKYLTGLYSFVENFIPENGNLKRRACFGPCWVHSLEDGWQRVKDVTFTCGGTEKRLDYDAKISDAGDGIWLQSGGFEGEAPKYRTKFELIPKNECEMPEDLNDLLP